MRIDCPSCQAAYDVPAPVVAAGRIVRCARCGVDFLPATPGSPAEKVEPAPWPAAVSANVNFETAEMRAPLKLAAEPLPPALVIHTPIAAASVPTERLVVTLAEERKAARPRANLPVLAGWLVSLAVLAAMGWGFLAWRAPIQRAWPASERVYAVLGLI